MNYLDELFEKYCNREYDEQAMASYPINDMHEANFQKALIEALEKQRELINIAFSNKLDPNLSHWDEEDKYNYALLCEVLSETKLEEL